MASLTNICPPADVWVPGTTPTSGLCLCAWEEVRLWSERVKREEKRSCSGRSRFWREVPQGSCDGGLKIRRLQLYAGEMLSSGIEGAANELVGEFCPRPVNLSCQAWSVFLTLVVGWSLYPSVSDHVATCCLTCQPRSGLDSM